MDRETTFERVKQMARRHGPASFAERIKNEIEPLPDFCAYIEELCVKKCKSRPEVISDACIEWNYGRQIFMGERNPRRDMVIKLAFGLGLDLDEAQYLLKVARKELFVGKDERDCIIMYAFVNGHSLLELDKTLYEKKLRTLGNKKYGS